MQEDRRQAEIVSGFGGGLPACNPSTKDFDKIAQSMKILLTDGGGHLAEARPPAWRVVGSFRLEVEGHLFMYVLLVSFSLR